jgi:hypothetical protein
MKKGVSFNLKLDGATAHLRSVLVYEAPLINSQFVLRASTPSAPVSKSSVVIDDPQRSTPCSTPEILEASSNIRHAVDDKDILVWPALLGYLSLAASKRLPNTVKGIQVHGTSPLTCTSESCIMGNIIQKPIQPSEDYVITGHFELIDSDVIGPMQT